MTDEPGAAEVCLFLIAALGSTLGGLLWTGLYGVPHHGRLGMALFVLGVVCATIFAALMEGDLEKSPQPHDGPPH